MTVNIGNAVKKVNIPYETVVSVSMWDLPGREEMDLRRSYYSDVDAAIGIKTSLSIRDLNFNTASHCFIILQNL